MFGRKLNLRKEYFRNVTCGKEYTIEMEKLAEKILKDNKEKYKTLNGSIIIINLKYFEF